nr:GEVED domain-containing protein [Woeseiaceae bacterium]
GFGEVEDYSIEIVPSTPQLPDAEFTASPTTVAVGGSVQFTDQSSGTPTSWSWSFAGGTPATSSEQNPSVTYTALGTYQVSLTATNGVGSNLETKSGYITVTDTPISYCDSSGGDQTYEYISRVQVGDLDNSSTASSYSDFTNLTASLTAGANASVTLTPGFNGDSYAEFWRIWIDYDGNGDFGDPGELVFSGSGSAAVTGSFVVPASASGATRMRVSMQYQSFANPCQAFGFGEVEDYSVQLSQ